LSPAWLDRAKMESLGFDTTVPDNADLQARTFGRQLSRDVLVVLEMDGPTYQLSRAAARVAAEKIAATNTRDSAKEAKEIIDEEDNIRSRLFVVDAGLDPAALRAKYPDRSKYAIVGGRVAPAGTRYSRTHTDHSGSVSALHADTINVPFELRPVFEGAQDRYRRSNARPVVLYDATVNFGRRLEPWLAAAARK
jgi:hypothetical protein